jgi:hypothetical protein
MSGFVYLALDSRQNSDCLEQFPPDESIAMLAGERENIS